MHRVQRLDDCRVLAAQLEQLAVRGESEPTVENTMTVMDMPNGNINMYNDKLMSSRLDVSNQLSSSSDMAKEARRISACCCPCHNGAENPVAATGALFRADHEAALERIKVLEQENAHLREKQVEIHQAKELYLKVLEEFPALIWRSGLDKMCDYFNRTWLEWTGKTTEQEKGIGWASGVHPDDFDQCLDIYTTAFDARQAFCMEYRLTDKFGQYRWIRDYGRPFYDLDDTFLGFIGSCYDITENKNNEQHVATVHKAKDKLFDLVTHDLRRPVATCVSLSEFLQENYRGLHDSEELREISLQLHQDARRTLELVDKLLQWTNQQQPQLRLADNAIDDTGGLMSTSFRPQVIMSQDLFRQVLSEVNLCAKAKKIHVQAGGYVGGLGDGHRSPRSSMDGLVEAGAHKDLGGEEDRVHYHHHAVVDGVMMAVDTDMILTVLRNLVMNGIKFTHPGGRIDLTAQGLDAETVLVAVTDTGVGMSEEVRCQLFRGPPSCPRPPRRGPGNELGSGMGAVLCRDLVERHGGRIWVAESTPGRGTRIEMTLPASMAQFQQRCPKTGSTNHIYYKLGVI